MIFVPWFKELCHYFPGAAMLCFQLSAFTPLPLVDPCLTPMGSTECVYSHIGIDHVINARV